MKKYFRYIGILLLTVVMASCGSSGGGGGAGDSSSNSGTSSLTVAVGNVSSSSGVISSASTTDIPVNVKSVRITVMIQGSIQERIINIAGRSGITETFTGPNGTWDVRVIAYSLEDGEGSPSHLGQTVQGVSGDALIIVQMVPVEAKFEVFVSNVSSGNVSAIDPATFEIRTIDCFGTSCFSPRYLAANHINSSVYVPVDGVNSVYDLNADAPLLNSSNEIFTDPQSYAPHAVDFNCDGSEAWVVNRGGFQISNGSISIINTITKDVENVSSECLFHPVAIAIANGKAYVANGDVSGYGYGYGYGDSNGDTPHNNVCVFDVATRSDITSIPTAGTPRHIVATPDGTLAYVSTSFGVQKISTGDDAIKHAIPLPTGGQNMGVAPDGSRVYVPNTSDKIMVIDINPAPAPDTSFGSVTVNGSDTIFGVAVTSDGSLIFATDEEMNEIYAFGPGMIVGGSVNPIVIPNSLGAWYPEAITSSPGVIAEECQTPQPPTCVPTLLELNPEEVLKDNAEPACTTDEDSLFWDFTWTGCADDGATSYELEVIEPDGTTVLLNETGILNSFFSHSTSTPVHSTSTPPAVITGLTWRVKAIFDAIEGAWSDTDTFDVEAENSDCVFDE